MAEEIQGQIKKVASFQTFTGVPGTNDSSSVSKHSVVQQGYFKDQYIHNFINKKSRRSPLINLGYYVRMVVIEKVLLEFIKSMQNCACQILSLGAGFDTSFFRLSDFQEYKDFTFFEIDLPEVVQRKASIILSCDELITKLKNVKACHYTGARESVDSHDCGLWSENYCLLAADLRDLSVVKSVLQSYDLDLNKPTLILSECSITYMDENSSRALIKFVEELLHNAVFITYEQICPDDGFGMVMINHFKVINSPLLSVTSYPLLKDQERRFLRCGWQHCCAISVWEAFINCTTEEGRSIVLRLEPFDEWEEWHLKCNHYALVLATKGCLLNWVPFSNFGNVSPLDSIVDPQPLHVEIHENYKINELFGHSSLIHSKEDKEYIVNIGGFGRLKNGSHGRLKNITCFKLFGNSFNEIETHNVSNDVFDFVHHSCTVLNNAESNQEIKFILYGGRQSPLSCVNHIPKLVHCKFNDVMSIETSYFAVESSLLLAPEPRWRHSACIIDINSTKLFIIFGGCSSNFKVLNDFWSINLNGIGEMIWQRLVLPTPPCGRFSHSVSVYGNRMYLSGGLNDRSEALSDLWVYEAGEMWMEIPVFGIIPRYGHTSHIIAWNDSSLYMILIGGVSTHRETWPGIAVIDLVNLTCIEYNFPCIEPVKSIMLQNHSTLLRKDKKSLYIVGGGGNCFSFGTKFNSYIAEVPLYQLFEIC